MKWYGVSYIEGKETLTPIDILQVKSIEWVTEVDKRSLDTCVYLAVYFIDGNIKYFESITQEV